MHATRRRFAILAAAIIAGAIVWACSPASVPSVGERVDDYIVKNGLVFHPAEIPAALPRLLPVDPHANSKLASWLRPGERNIDIWQNFIRSNRGGWWLAVRQMGGGW